jgi:hypothetical protein
MAQSATTYNDALRFWGMVFGIFAGCILVVLVMVCCVHLKGRRAPARARDVEAGAPESVELTGTRTVEAVEGRKEDEA